MGQFAHFASANVDRFALCTELSSQFVAFSQRLTEELINYTLFHMMPWAEKSDQKVATRQLWQAWNGGIDRLQVSDVK